MSVANPDVPLDDRVKGRAFAILFAVLLSSAAGNTALQTVLPAIGREVGIPDVLISSIFSLSALLWGVMSSVWARMSDKRGRKPMVILGMAGFAVWHGDYYAVEVFKHLGLPDGAVRIGIVHTNMEDEVDGLLAAMST